MSFVLPNPTTPTDGQPGDAVPILQNEQAIAQAITNFDGSQINPGSVTASALANNINPQVRDAQIIANFVHSGCIWSMVSGFNGTMTGGIIYVNGYQVTVNGVGSQTFAASSDTYVDIDYLGNIYYNAVANNASSPTLTANTLRVAKVVTNGSTITSVLQTGIDSTKNIIYPTFLTKGTADANGWVKKDYGNWQCYEQTFAVTNATVGHQTNAIIVASQALPVGVIDNSYLRFQATWVGGFGGRIVAGLDNGNTASNVTTLGIMLGNLQSTDITGLYGNIYIQAITV